jgi:ribosome-binding protein aMBF1 (putative translation factor)
MQGVKGSGDPMAWQSYYQRNRERLLAKSKAYRIKNRNYVSEWNRKHYLESIKQNGAAQACIGEARRAAGLRQWELAEYLHVSQTMISRWEVGASKADVEMLLAAIEEAAEIKERSKTHENVSTAQSGRD